MSPPRAGGRQRRRGLGRSPGRPGSSPRSSGVPVGAERGLLGLAPPLPPQHSAEATPVHAGFDQHMTYWLRRTRAAEHPDAQVVVLLWVVRLETIRQSGHGLIVPNPPATSSSRRGSGQSADPAVPSPRNRNGSPEHGLGRHLRRTSGGDQQTASGDRPLGSASGRRNGALSELVGTKGQGWAASHSRRNFSAAARPRSNSICCLASSIPNSVMPTPEVFTEIMRSRTPGSSR